jgi:hypothetical protein
MVTKLRSFDWKADLCISKLEWNKEDRPWDVSFQF